MAMGTHPIAAALAKGSQAATEAILFGAILWAALKVPEKSPSQKIHFERRVFLTSERYTLRLHFGFGLR